MEAAALSVVPIGVVHGRFQPLHIGHMEYLLAGKHRCDFLVVGITNPDPTLTAHHSADQLRSLPGSNPFTYYERLIMVRESLCNAGVARDEFDITPFPINCPRVLEHYVPMTARFFVTIYDDWGRAKLEVLRSRGMDVQVMWERSMSDRLTTGAEVRELIATGGRWEHLVPPAVTRIIRERGLDKRISQSRIRSQP